MAHPPRPTLPELAALLHEAARSSLHPCIFQIVFRDPYLDLGVCKLTDATAHPADALIGFRAEPQVSVIGLAAPGRARVLPGDVRTGAGTGATSSGPVGPEGPVSTTVLLDRTGEAASCIQQGSAPAHHLGERPQGWMADALARALGLATPPPCLSLVAAVEGAWLDALASLAFRTPTRRITWDDVARLHPLAGTEVLAPQLLAHETEEFATSSSWARLRRLYARQAGTEGEHPEGRLIDPVHWFDDGSFSRWFERQVRPAADLPAAVFERLPDDVGRQLYAALVELGHPAHRPPRWDAA